MASHTIAADKVAKHAFTLVASTADTVTISGASDKVEIISDGTAAVYYSTNGTAATVAGAHCYLLPAGAISVDVREYWDAADAVISLISAGTPTLSVQVVR